MVKDLMVLHKIGGEASISRHCQFHGHSFLPRYSHPSCPSPDYLAANNIAGRDINSNCRSKRRRASSDDHHQ